jgi:hypothetical protein
MSKPFNPCKLPIPIKKPQGFLKIYTKSTKIRTICGKKPQGF